MLRFTTRSERDKRRACADGPGTTHRELAMKRKRCAKCTGKGTIVCAVCAYFSFSRANYGWINPLTKAATRKQSRGPNRVSFKPSGSHK